ncbi:hypothetical protein AB0I52_21305 [Streptomyces sp. NPDC050423]|uniref:hypothetical protein n=1 Tax=Streptomyces sp. NPDC050423 TaxID=3155402 RepID=UPI00342EDFE4
MIFWFLFMAFGTFMTLIAAWPLGLLVALPLLLVMRASARNVRAKYASLSIDGTGLSVDKPGWPPFQIPWEHVSHLGVLHGYVFSTKYDGVLKADNVLIVRLSQSSPRIKGTWFAPRDGKDVLHSLRRIGYVGFPIQDFNADPTQLRQAVERLSDRPYRSDLELGEVDPRLRSVVSDT